MKELKSSYLQHYGINQRLVNETDADFIFRLRTDPLLSQFLSKTDGSVEDQVQWIKKYKEREVQKLEFYFITEVENERKGLNRLYNFDSNSFEIGSWLFMQDTQSPVAILSDLAARDFGFGDLRFDFCRFEVRKDNKSVLNYHKLFSPEKYGEDEKSLFFQLSKDQYIQTRNKLLKIYSYDT